MTPTNGNGCTGGEPVQPQSSKTVSKIHNAIIARSPYGVSSDGWPFPRPGTCKAAVLACLLTDDEMTHRSFDGLAHSMRAAIYVQRLRDDGWPIVTRLVQGKNRFEPVRYAKYSLADGVTIGDAEETFVMAAQMAAEGWL